MDSILPVTLTLLAANAKQLAIGAALTSLVWFLEWLRPAGDDPGLKGRWHNLKVFAFLLLGLMLSTPLVNWCAQLIPAISLIERIVPNWQDKGLLGAIAATLIYALVWDFFQYWTHRLEHRFAVLWLFHRAHHSDTQINASTSLRQSLGGALLGFWFAHIPTAIICGGNLLPYLGALVLFSGWGYFNHANLRIPLGPLTPWLSGPQWHRMHHGRDSQHHNSNYAAFFPFFDRLFGTYQQPAKDEWVATGIEGDTSPRGAFTQAFLPWLQRPGQQSTTPRLRRLRFSGENRAAAEPEA
jgi:sterol desaturase/sphingolipid hydroxylase (fatty acid hydroxylase superfamily)